jgi:cysteinyl-tRNA synthetase
MVHSTFEGQTIDLHGGGIDLCFPHHENEIAQSQSAYEQTFCTHWFHSAHLRVENKKMSKSLGNLYTLDQLVKKNHTPMALRYTLIASSYRQPLNFTFDGLRASESALNKIERFAEALLEKANLSKERFNENFVITHQLKDFGLLQDAWEGLSNNLNTSACLGSLFGLIGSNPISKLNLAETENLLKALGSILYGLGLQLFSNPKQDSEAPQAILELAKERWEAKQNKDYSKADSLRKSLQKEGWDVKDTPTHFELFPLNK